MKNTLNREVINGFIPYSGKPIDPNNRILIPTKLAKEEVVSLKDISDSFDHFHIDDGMTLSFHHHLRNGDGVVNMVLAEIKRRGLKNMKLAISSIFPIHEPLVELLENRNVTQIYTNYISGPVAQAISAGKMQDVLILNTHGGRARAIESGEIVIDVAFLATPCIDKKGNGNGSDGVNACGSLGYALSDLQYAKNVVLISDTLVEQLASIELDHRYVDATIMVSSIGDQKGIVSGTTKITKDPVGLLIARYTTQLLEELGQIQPGFSMQTGAGGTSLACAKYIKDVMMKKKIRGSFASGGITSYLVSMLNEGLFDRLYDVQCFDLDAVESYKNNPNHIGMSASKYANPYEEGNIASQLDFVILGATEIDVNYNVNVTTSSNGTLMGGSGGHADTARGAKLTIITTPLIKSRIPIVKEQVTTITTPGEFIDVLVTERGIAINPLRTDVIDALKNTKLPLLTIEQLLATAHSITGIPKSYVPSGKVIAVSQLFDGTISDCIYQK